MTAENPFAGNEPVFSTQRKIGLLLGAAAFLLMEALPAPTGLTGASQHCAAVALLMAIWWATEALPLSATALFPLLGVLPVTRSVAPYAHRVVMLLPGGFILALSMQRWNLHRRVGGRCGLRGAGRLVGGWSPLPSMGEVVLPVPGGWIRSRVSCPRTCSKPNCVPCSRARDTGSHRV